MERSSTNVYTAHEPIKGLVILKGIIRSSIAQTPIQGYNNQGKFNIYCSFNCYYFLLGN